MPREKAQVVQTARPKVPMRRLGADCFVVLLKRGNARGAKGAGHRHLARVNRQREEPDVQWKAAAFARWHEPYDARVSSQVLYEARGEIPRGYSAIPESPCVSDLSSFRRALTLHHANMHRSGINAPQCTRNT